jgi:hypothetical protein
MSVKPDEACRAGCWCVDIPRRSRGWDCPCRWRQCRAPPYGVGPVFGPLGNRVREVLADHTLEGLAVVRPVDVAQHVVQRAVLEEYDHNMIHGMASIWRHSDPPRRTGLAFSPSHRRLKLCVALLTAVSGRSKLVADETICCYYFSRRSRCGPASMSEHQLGNDGTARNVPEAWKV